MCLCVTVVLNLGRSESAVMYVFVPQMCRVNLPARPPALPQDYLDQVQNRTKEKRYTFDVAFDTAVGGAAGWGGAGVFSVLVWCCA